MTAVYHAHFCRRCWPNGKHSRIVQALLDWWAEWPCRRCTAYESHRRVMERNEAQE